MERQSVTSRDPVLQSLRTDREFGEHLRVRVWAHPENQPLVSAFSAHNAVEVTWVCEGEVRYRLGNTEIVVKAGQAIVVPLEVEHLTQLGRGVVLGSARLAPTLIAEMLDVVSPEARQLTCGLVAKPQRLFALGQLLVAEAEGVAPGQSLAADALCEALAIETLREAPRRTQAPGVRHPRIALALDHLEAHHAEPLNMAAVAKQLGMSRFQFAHLFREQVGQSPYQYLITRRITHASALLRRGHRSVTEAALSVGFQDLGRFSRSFRRQLGCSPREYRRAHLVH